tara:strand:- start:843 stop:1118 length:276 start_codon:yes stop_codon:yes gene_type:complete
MIDGLIFGFIDNAVLIAGAVTGYEVERFLPRRFQVGVGAIAGAGIGNTVSDALGAVLDPALVTMTGGIVLGCLIPLVVIPLIAVRNSRRNA